LTDQKWTADTRLAAKKPFTEKGYALVIAIANYERIRRLPLNVLDDATDIAAMLTAKDRCGYDPSDVVVLLDESATKDAVMNGLDRLAAAASPGDTVCIYFSGHGTVGSDEGESNLLPVDFNEDEPDSTWISADELTLALKNVKSERMLVFLDACHSAGAAALKGESSIPEFLPGFAMKTLERLSDGVGRVVIASSRATEASLILPLDRNSVFTKFLLEGLAGAADSDGSGVVRVFGLFEYVSKNVELATSSGQHPVMAASKLEQNFPITIYPKSENPHHSQKICTSDEFWASLAKVAADLYPLGPTTNEIWSRAGGDISKLNLHGSGSAAWFSSLKILRNGGGGDLDVTSLIAAMMADFPKHVLLADLRSQSSNAFIQ
jgi:metacaspase-1